MLQNKRTSINCSCKTKWCITKSSAYSRTVFVNLLYCTVYSNAHYREKAPADSFVAAEQKKKREESIKRGLLEDEKQLLNYCE